MYSDIVYWAILLTDNSKADLLSKIPAKHTRVFAEHITIVFSPTLEENELMSQWLGKKVKFKVITRVDDDKGQAVGVLCEPDRLDGKLAHITISCSNGTNPVYSNKLMEKGKNMFCAISPFELDGTVAKYTKRGWITRDA